jgi:hypothetical protein
VATSKLQIAVGDMLDRTFPQYRIRENYRPDWLMSSNITKLELDFYIEELKIGIEVQGAQHYQFVPHFHGTLENYEKRKQYDKEKKDLCDGAGIKLVEIFSLMDAITEIKSLEDKYDHLIKPIMKANALRRYVKEQNSLSLHDNMGATPEQKIAEIKQFKKKARKHPEAIIHFAFRCLDREEQLVFLEEASIQKIIDNHSNIRGAYQSLA